MNRFSSVSRSFRIVGTSPLLGSQPVDREVRLKYLGSKSAMAFEENADMPFSGDKGTTVFLRDKECGGALYIGGHVMKGMFKEALSILQSQTSDGISIELKQPAAKVDNYVFIQPRKLWIQRSNDVFVVQPDRTFNRPVRIASLQGDRTALLLSELVELPWQFDARIELVTNKGSRVSGPLSWENLLMALEFGSLKGFGQFRNGGYGTYTYTEIE
ncbi:hypothetical protein AGMMS49992_11630 [Clostridia bacterium]|nr:hypothetical protein AGMMS49992_11630 [Clostridia bacterium]